MMKKAITIICILLCAAAAFAGTMSFQLGFSILGANAGATVSLTDSVKMGGAISVARLANQAEDNFGWIYAQGLLSVDLIPNVGNDLDLRFGLSYLNINGNDGFEDEEGNKTEPTYMKFAGLTFGIQYTHWFGYRRSHGVFVGIDIPVGGYVSYYSYGEVEEHGPFIGPLTSMATLGVLLTSMRTGYCFQF